MHYRRIELPVSWPVRERIGLGVVVAVVLHGVALLVLSVWLGLGVEWVDVGFG